MVIHRHMVRCCAWDLKIGERLLFEMVILVDGNIRTFFSFIHLDDVDISMIVVIAVNEGIVRIDGHGL